MENEYLTNIPQEIEKHGFSKVLIVRYETIHIKHILTEIFVRKTIDIEKHLNLIQLDLFSYIEFMTNRLRKIYNFSRKYSHNLNDIISNRKKNFFPTLDFYKGLNNCVVLDFDGVLTSKKFTELYKLCIKRHKTFICSANPNITKDWFLRHGLPLPDKIYSMKGRVKKLYQLLEIAKKYDNLFYVDDENKYLEFAWIFGIKTFKYKSGKIKRFSLNIS